MKKVATKRDELDAGNYDDTPSLAALQQMSSEVNREEDNDKDLFTDLIMERNKLEMSCKGTVFMLSFVPFSVAWCTAMMANHIKKLSKVLKPLIAYLDSTGSLIRALPWAKDKVVYNYNIVVKEEKSPPIPVSEYMTNDHHEFEIAHWIARLKEQYIKITSEALPFKIVVTDMSWAMTNAVLQELCGMSLMQYLKACMQANAEGSVNFVILAWCYAHFIQAMIRRVGKCLSAAKIFNPAKRLVKFLMASLARTSNLDDAQSLFKLGVIIFDNKKFTKQVKEAIKTTAARLGASDADLLQEDDVEDEPVVIDFNFPEIPISIPEDDRACSSHLENYKDSPFFKVFEQVFKSVVVDTTADKEDDNPFYVPKFVDYLMKYILPFYPLWSRFVQKILLPTNENPVTNFAVELRFLLTKQETWVRKKYRKAPRFLRLMVKDAERRITECKYPLNFKKYKKRKPKKANADKENEARNKIPKTSPPNQSSSRPAIEKWRAFSKNMRKPGGHYSKVETKKYATTLLKRALILARKGRESSAKDVTKNLQQIPNSDKDCQENMTSSTSNTQSCVNSMNGIVNGEDLQANSEAFDAIEFSFSKEDCQENMTSSTSNTQSCVNSMNGIVNGEDPQANSEAFDAIEFSFSKEDRPKNMRLSIDSCEKQQPLCQSPPWCSVTISEILRYHLPTQLSLHDIKSCKPNSFFTDIVISKFLERRQLLAMQERFLNFVVFPASCITTVQLGGDQFIGLCRRMDIMKSDVWIIPLYDISRVHYSLLIVVFKKMEILHLDPKQNFQKKDNVLSAILPSLMGVVSLLHRQTFGTVPKWSEWRLYSPLDTPQQPINSAECGPMICIFADAILGGTSSLPSSKEFAQVRQWILSEASQHITQAEDLVQGYHRTDNIIEDNPDKIKKLFSCPPGSSSTFNYLVKLRSSLYSSTSVKCSKVNCSGEGQGKIMVFCYGLKCRDWLHLKCCKDRRREASLPDDYRCPDCLHRIR